MTNHSDQTLIKFWRAGVPLSESWLTYAHPDLKPKWKAAMGNSALKAFEHDAANAGKANVSTDEKFTIAFSGVQKILSKRAALQEQLRANILQYIKSRALIGYGFEVPRTLSSIPVELKWS